MKTVNEGFLRTIVGMSCRQCSDAESLASDSDECTVIIGNMSTVQCSEIHATCRAETDGEYADAMGTDS